MSWEVPARSGVCPRCPAPSDFCWFFQLSEVNLTWLSHQCLAPGGAWLRCAARLRVGYTTDPGRQRVCLLLAELRGPSPVPVTAWLSRLAGGGSAPDSFLVTFKALPDEQSTS